MKNHIMKPIFLMFLLTVCFETYSQSFFDNPNKVWGSKYKEKITKGAIHISRINSDSEKVFLSIKEGERIPDQVWELSNLKVLDIRMSYNGCCPVIGEIPSQLDHLKQLEYIYFKEIGIESLPSDLGNLTNLKSIYISEVEAVDAKLKQLTDFSKLPMLQVIYIDLNGKSNISLVDNFSTIFDKTGLKILALNNAKIKSDIFQHSNEPTQLEILELKGNELREIPSIYKNKQLKQLYLRGNELTSVHSDIGLLREMEVLDLAYNNLSELPSEIGNLTKLKMLDLNDNKLESLPASFKNLDQLEYLILRGNNLTEIPEFIFHLKNLKDLDLMSTRISTIDERILSTNIEAIRISHQDIGGFNFDPKMLSQLKSLKTFQTSNLKAEKELLKSKNKLKKLRPDIY